MNTYGHYQEVYDEVEETSSIVRVYRDKKTHKCVCIGEAVSLSGMSAKDFPQLSMNIQTDLATYPTITKSILYQQIKEWEELLGTEEPGIEGDLVANIELWEDFLKSNSDTLPEHYKDAILSYLGESEDLLGRTIALNEKRK